MSDESPTVINRQRNKSKSNQGFLESDLPKTNFEVITSSEPKVPYKMTLTEKNMGLAPALQEKVIGRRRLSPAEMRKRKSPKVTEEMLAKAAEQYPIAGPIPEGLIERGLEGPDIGMDLGVDPFDKGPQVPLTGQEFTYGSEGIIMSGGQEYIEDPDNPGKYILSGPGLFEGITEEQAQTGVASQMAGSLSVEEQIIQNNFQQEQLERERKIRRDIYDKAEGDAGPIETFFLGDDERSMGERFVSKASGITGAGIAGVARGAAIVPLLVDHTVQLGTWGIQNSWRTSIGEEAIPYNQNWMANNLASQVTRGLINMSGVVKKTFDVDNGSAAQSIIGSSFELLMPIKAWQRPMELGKTMINMVSSASQGMRLAERARTSWQSATTSALRNTPKIEVDLTNQYFTQKAKEAKKLLITEKFRLKQLESKSHNLTVKEIKQSTQINEAQKNIAIASKELEDAMSKANVFEGVMAKFTPILKNQFLISGKGLNFRIWAKESKGLSGTVFRPNKKGVMEAVNITKQPTVKDIARYRARQRSIHIQASIGGGMAMGLWEQYFKNDPDGWENYKYISALLGGIFLQPSLVLRAGGKLADVLQSQILQTAIPLSNNKLLGKLGHVLGDIIPGSKLPNSDQSMFGIGNILIIAAMLNNNVKRYGASNIWKTRTRSQDQIENPQGAFNRGLGIPAPVNPSKVLFDSPYERRLLLAVAGVPLSRAFLANADKPIMKKQTNAVTGELEETSEFLFQTPRNPNDPKYRSDLDATAPENMIPVTELGMLEVTLGYNTRRMQKISQDLMNTLTREELDGILKLHESTAALHAKLLRMGKEDSFEFFHLTNEMAELAARSQLELTAFAPLMMDVKYRRNYMPLGLGRITGKEGVAKKALTQEGEIIVELIRGSLKEVDVNINMIATRLSKIADDPALKKEFSKYVEQMEKFKLHLENNQQKLKNTLENYNISTTKKEAKEIVEEMEFQRAVYSSKEDGGLGLNSRFALNEDPVSQGIALKEHSTNTNNVIANVRTTLSEKVDEAFKYKDPSNPLAVELKNTVVEAEPVLQTLRDLRNTEIDNKIFPLREILGDDWVKLGIQQSNSLISDLLVYSKYVSLKNKEYGELKGILEGLEQAQVPVFLRRSSYIDQGVSKSIQGDTQDAFGLLDLTKILSKIDEYAPSHGQTLEIGRTEYLRRLLTNIEQKKDSVAWKGSPSHLDDVIGNEFKMTDLLNITQGLTSFGFKNNLNASGVQSFNIKEAINEILEQSAVVEMTQEAKDLWARAKRFDEVIQKQLPNQANRIGQVNAAREEHEFLDFFFTRPREYVDNFYGNLFNPIKKDGADMNLFKGARDKMNGHLNDHLAIRLVTSDSFRKNAFNNKEMYTNIAELNRKGIINDDTFTFYKNFRNRYNNIPNLIGEYTKEFKSLDKLIKDVIKKSEDSLNDSTLFKQLEKIDDVDSLYAYFSGSNMNSLMSPKMLSGEVVSPETLQVIKEKFGNLNIKDTDDFASIVKKNPNMTASEIEEVVELFMPVVVKEAQTDRIDGFLKYVLKITPDKALTKKDIVNLNNLEKVLNASLAKRAIKITNIRQSVFSNIPEGEARIAGDLSFGLRNTIDVTEFANHFINLRSLYDKIDDLTGNTVRQNNLDDLYKLSVASLGTPTPALRSLQDILGSGPAGQLTLPAALGRGFSGVRGVVSWKYLAAEQIARQTNLGKQRLLLEMIGDPNLVNVLIKMGMNRKPTSVEVKEFKDVLFRIAKIAGARVVAYNEMKEEILNPTDDQLVKSFQREYNAFEFGKLIRTVPPERVANPPRATQPITIEFADGVKGKTALEGPLLPNVTKDDIELLQQMQNEQE